MRQTVWLTIALFLVLAAGCAKQPRAAKKGGFQEDADFLSARVGTVVLRDASGARLVAVSPQLQGRVMTSTADGPSGLSFGWINRELISSGVNNPHINAFGGEDRFWLGPEGGQFSIFFKQGDSFDLDHWFTPPPVNEEAFETVEKSDAAVRFRKPMRLINYSGTVFDLDVERTVRLLDEKDLSGLGLSLPAGVRMVAFASENRVTNTGQAAWSKDTGLLSIWILGMFNPSPKTTIVVPFKPGPESELGPVVNDAYFGKVPPDRLKVSETGVIYFKGDGLYRSKIGIAPARVRPFAGSWDAENGVLTIVHLTVPEGATDYVNSMWQIQERPFAGDVVNSYNDGPAAPGAKPLGPFYELESSSPAAALKPGESLTHVHTTIHLLGDRSALDAVAKAVLGAGLKDIEAAFAAGTGR